MFETKNKSTFDFPLKSNTVVKDTFTWDEVKSFLDKEYMRRAEYIADIVLAMKERYGEEVYDIVRKVIYNIGFEKGKTRAKIVKEKGHSNDLDSLAELVSHRLSRLYYGTSPEVNGDKLVIKETYCPLPIKWKEMGMENDEIIRFCLLFDQVDKGMVEGYNDNFAAELTGCKGLSDCGFCQMVVRVKK
ncbi:MAG: L-2-amino-thiazoline-4-carboxylic acid hydrolase [Chloroflexi bacterium]|nr:L-2-amino-thiazoline-4-carboxylic acid hydrolase [Chloroflexota bacterium]